MLNLPHNIKELRQFLGMVQCYRDMWAKHSEMLAPLTDLVRECGETKATKRNGTKKGTMEVGFYASTSIWQRQVYHCQRGSTGLSGLYKAIWDILWCLQMQLGAVITQRNRPIAFFSRKLSKVQTKYSITKIELLAMVETL